VPFTYYALTDRITMSTLIIADPHLDVWAAAGRDPLAGLDAAILADLDALIIAGDLSNDPVQLWPRHLERLAHLVGPGKLHIIPGNHDYYGHVLDDEDTLAEICISAGGRLAQKSEIIVGRDRVLCCTLWTDFALHGDALIGEMGAQKWMNDYKQIRGRDDRMISPGDTAAIHRDHLSWLGKALERPFRGRTIVVTHHAPHPALAASQDACAQPAYASDLIGFIHRYQPDAWLFGHTHHRSEAMVGNTVVRNVSFGYPWEVPPGTEVEILQRGLIS